MASASGSGGGTTTCTPPVSIPGGDDAAGGGEAGPDAPPEGWVDALRAAEAAARAARVTAVLAARFPEVFTVPGLPVDAWSLIMDRAASCRCAGGDKKASPHD